MHKQNSRKMKKTIHTNYSTICRNCQYLFGLLFYIYPWKYYIF